MLRDRRDAPFGYYYVVAIPEFAGRHPAEVVTCTSWEQLQQLLRAVYDAYEMLAAKEGATFVRIGRGRFQSDQQRARQNEHSTGSIRHFESIARGTQQSNDEPAAQETG